MDLMPLLAPSNLIRYYTVLTYLPARTGRSGGGGLVDLDFTIPIPVVLCPGHTERALACCAGWLSFTRLDLNQKPLAPLAIPQLHLHKFSFGFCISLQR